jgi:tRNA (guanine37-N1)-methyltransferase
VEAVLGDVNKVVPRKFKGAFDRVVMPLPKGGEDFLAAAISSIKPSGGTVHFYQFVPLDDPYTEALELVREECKNAGRKCRILNKKKVRSFSASTIQIVVDFYIK